MSARRRWLCLAAALSGCAGAPKAGGASDGPADSAPDASADDGAGAGAGSDGGGADGGAEGAADGADGGEPPRDIGCADVDLGSAIGLLAEGSLDGAGDGHGYCGAPLGADGEDRLFYWVAPAAGPYTFSTAGSDFDTMLTLYLGACVSIEACNDDYDGVVSAVDAVLVEGDVVVIALDAYTLGELGRFQLSVARGALPPEPSGDTGDTADTGGGTGGADTADAALGLSGGPGRLARWFDRMIQWLDRGAVAMFG